MKIRLFVTSLEDGDNSSSSHFIPFNTANKAAAGGNFKSYSIVFLTGFVNNQIYICMTKLFIHKGDHVLTDESKTRNRNYFK